MALDVTRSAPTRRLLLGRSDVHLWVTSLDVSGSTWWRLRRTLSQDELDRASGFADRQRRARFVVGRGMLRQILSGYIGSCPKTLVFRYECTCGGERCHPWQRKPELAEAGIGLTFNLSHSANLALCAVTRSRGVGVDVEAIRPELVEEEVIARILGQVSLKAWRALPEDLRVRTFYTWWTRHEAYGKGIGRGLLGTSTEGAVREARAGLGEAWSVVDLAIAPGYAAALAVERKDWRLSIWRVVESDSTDPVAHTSDRTRSMSLP